MASEDVTNGVGRERDALLDEVAGKPLASIAGLLVERQHPLLGVGVGFGGLAFGGSGEVF